ncbi:MAG: hypothetical protein JST96_16625 [Bacteroidetes bacterium]|nr:hypothetical protein [Bacteroidota bacterium]
MESRKTSFALFALAFIFLQLHVAAQNNGITTYQYRRVPENKIDEFVKRETTYWSKVAQKAIDAKKLTFWALLEKVGGYDLPNSSNFLFINTYTNVDQAGDVWGKAEAITGMKMAQIETNSMSTTTSMFFVHDENWAQAASAVPPKDFNYVVMIYHNTNYPDSLINLEKTYWLPFIQKAMDNHQTPQMAWGNSIVLSPSADNIKFNTVSFDLYKTLADALMPKWDTNAVFPVEGLTKINNIEINRRGSVIYRVVKVVSAN